jgi:hypothetical protein
MFVWRQVASLHNYRQTDMSGKTYHVGVTNVEVLIPHFLLLVCLPSSVPILEIELLSSCSCSSDQVLGALTKEYMKWALRGNEARKCLYCVKLRVLHNYRQTDMSGKTYHVGVTNVEDLTPHLPLLVSLPKFCSSKSSDTVDFEGRQMKQ